MASHSSCTQGKAALAALMLFGALPGCHRARLSRGDAAPVVVVAPGRDAAVPRRTAELEPNDSPEQAQLLTLDPEWPVIDVEGTLSAASKAADGRDVDVFKLQVPGPATNRAAEPSRDGGQAEDWRRSARRLSLEIAPEEGTSVTLQVLDAALKVLETVSAENGQPAGMPNLAAQPGQLYYIRVKAVAKSGKTAAPPAASKYKLSLQLGDFDVAEEREPNDSRETAEDLAMAGMAELAGYHGWQHDQDFFRVQAPEVVSALDAELDGVEGVTPSLQVLSGSGARLAWAKGRKGEGAGVHNVKVAARAVDAGAQAGAFYVVVRAEAGQNRNQRYVLHLSLGALRQDTEVEPNDTPADATVLRDGAVTGFLSAGDVDTFAYDSSEPRELTLEVAFPPHLRGRVELSRGSKGEVVAAVESKKAHQQIVISGVATLGERLFLRLAPVKGEGNAKEPYTIKVTSAPSAAEARAPQIRVSP